MLEKQKEYLKELEKHKASFTAKKDRIDKPVTYKAVEGLKPLICRFPETKEASTAALKKLTDKIVKEESNFYFIKRP